MTLMLASNQRPVFQMHLGLGPALQVGWLFSGEEEQPSYHSPAFTVAWRPDLSFKEAEYIFPGEVRGEYAHFRFRFDGSLFVLRLDKSFIRLALRDPLSLPQDFRGMPFYRVFPYVGRNQSVLEYYGKSDFYSFLALTPLDVLEMDRLYLDSRVAFVGVTPRFGPHLATREPVLIG
jgi:hypothetical protein